MHLDFMNFSFDTYRHETKRELVDYLSKCNCGFVLLGSDSQGRSFYSVSVAIGWSALKRFGIGIIVEMHEIKPHLMLMNASAKILIGFDCKAILIDLEIKEVMFEYEFDSPFVRFIVLSGSNSVLVFHEIGVALINSEGKMVWEVSQDIITDVSIGSSLLLEFSDSPSIAINLRDGSLRKHT